MTRLNAIDSYNQPYESNQAHLIERFYRARAPDSVVLRMTVFTG
jgi:hypothetical protein